LKILPGLCHKLSKILSLEYLYDKRSTLAQAAACDLEGRPTQRDGPRVVSRADARDWRRDIRYDDVRPVWQNLLNLCDALRLRDITPDCVYTRERINRLDVNGHHPARWPHQLGRDLAPTARRSAQIQNRCARPYQAELIVDLYQLVGRSGPIPLDFGFSEVLVSALLLSPRFGQLVLPW
jgi:hypothetical protein